MNDERTNHSNDIVLQVVNPYTHVIKIMYTTDITCMKLADLSNFLKRTLNFYSCHINTDKNNFNNSYLSFSACRILLLIRFVYKNNYLLLRIAMIFIDIYIIFTLVNIYFVKASFAINYNRDFNNYVLLSSAEFFLLLSFYLILRNFNLILFEASITDLRLLSIFPNSSPHLVRGSSGLRFTFICFPQRLRLVLTYLTQLFESVIFSQMYSDLYYSRASKKYVMNDL
ncbi:hypothetical protein PUN28_012056 [Cardiocondyla obscurior]|uniref:Uncharacterized protein n=1 Tax=Cardiocondyla obscurior TaxID=286306 RepID=A0AAW2F943_9HYME